MNKKGTMQFYIKISSILAIFLMVFSTGFSSLPAGVLEDDPPAPAEAPTPVEEPAPEEEPVEVPTTEPRRAAVTPPEMDVLCIATAVSIPNGDTSPTVEKCTDFGELEIVYTMDNHNLSVWNTGTLDLVLDGNPRVAVSGHISDFSISLQPTTPISGGNHSQFDVMFTPTAVGLRTATITIENNDSDEDPYTFTVQGTGILSATTTTISGDSPDPSDVDQSYTVSVAMYGPYATPTGTVDIDDGSGASCTATLSSGSGSCSLTSTSGGAKTLTANYSGDSNHATSSDTEPHSVTYTEDNYEENDTLPSSYDLSSYPDTWLSTIDGPGYQVDDDWYEIYVSSGSELVQVEALFTHSGGDINIGLFDSMGILQEDSASTTDNESINFTVPSAGTYYIAVYAYNTGNEYDLWWDDLSPPAQTLTISKSGTGSGTVTSVPAGIDCGSDCSEVYAYGTSVTLTPNPDTGSTFTSWSGDCSGTVTCVLPMTADSSATATFSLDDNYEENDSPGAAYDLSSDKGTWLAAVNGLGIQADHDWYEIYVNSGYENILVDLRFSHSQGDINIALFDSSQALVTISDSTTDNEYIDYTVPSSGTYYLWVGGANEGNAYDLWWDDIAIPGALTIKPRGTIQDHTPEYKWSKIDGATKYQFQVIKRGGDVLIDKVDKNPNCDATACYNTPNYWLKDSPYKWRVRSYKDGVWSAYSAYKRFYVSNPFSAQFNGSKDDFRDKAGTWDTTSSALYTYGLPDQSSSIYHKGSIYDDFIFTAKVMREDDPDSGNYLAVRTGIKLSPPDNDLYWGYLFGYRNDGYYSILARDKDGVEVTLQPWTATSAVVDGGWNTLKVVASDATFKFYINGTKVSTINNPTPTLNKGYVAFEMYKSSGDSPTSRFLVDYATLTMQ